MEVKFYKPKNIILQKYIAGYYFFVEDKNSKIFSYLTFPNNYCILSFYKNAVGKFSDNRYVIKASLEDNIWSSLVTRYIKPIEIIYENMVHEVTIYFKPSAINHFIDCSLFFKNFTIPEFSPFPDYKEKISSVFDETNRDRQIELLENHLLSHFEKKDLGLVEQIIEDIENDLNQEEIANKYNFTRQHINLLFSKKVGKSPIEFRKIHRFRNALANCKTSKNLTSLSHQNLFFDQSHFIKDFKKLTGSKPKDFFKKVNTDQENIWFFI